MTLVARRELPAFGRVLSGKAPAGLLSAVADQELGDFVVSGSSGGLPSTTPRCGRAGAGLTRDYLGPAIDALVASYD